MLKTCLNYSKNNLHTTRNYHKYIKTFKNNHKSSKYDRNFAQIAKNTWKITWIDANLTEKIVFSCQIFIISRCFTHVWKHLWSFSEDFQWLLKILISLSTVLRWLLVIFRMFQSTWSRFQVILSHLYEVFNVSFKF